MKKVLEVVEAIKTGIMLTGVIVLFGFTALVLGGLVEVALKSAMQYVMLYVIIATVCCIVESIIKAIKKSKEDDEDEEE